MAQKEIPQSWNEVLNVASPLICGIVNVTPDSFSDGNQYSTQETCDAQISKLISEGALIIDVGAESTRPNSLEVLSETELIRLHNALDIVNANSFSQLFSIDTRHSETARIAIENGFSIINDVSGGTFDQEMNSVIAETGALCILMHMRGTPETMNEFALYGDLVDEVIHELEMCVTKAEKAGVAREKIMIDPGIGFAKNLPDSALLFEKCAIIKERLGLPMMVGISRKSVVSYLLTGDPQAATISDRDVLTAQLSSLMADQGIDAIRVHNVAMSVEAIASSKQ